MAKIRTPFILCWPSTFTPKCVIGVLSELRGRLSLMSTSKIAIDNNETLIMPPNDTVYDENTC